MRYQPPQLLSDVRRVSNPHLFMLEPVITSQKRRQLHAIAPVPPRYW